MRGHLEVIYLKPVFLKKVESVENGEQPQSFENK